MGLFKPNVERLAQKRDVKGLAKALFYEKDPNVRCAAAKALDKIGDIQAVEPLVAALRDTDKYVQKAASQALVQMGEKAVGPLVEVVTGDLGIIEYGTKLDVRRMAAESLAAIASMTEVDGLIAAFSSADQSVRKFSATALSWNHEARVSDALISLLGDKDYYVCLEAAKSLGKIGDPRAVEPLIEVLQSGSPPREVARALGEIGDLRAVQPLIDALEAQVGKDHHWELPQSIIEALSKLGDTRAIEPLNTFLSHKSSYEKGSELTRSALASALGTIGDSMVVAVLTRTLNTDPEEVVKVMAAVALGRLAERGQLGFLAGITRIALKAESEAGTPAVRKYALEALDKLAEVEN